MLLEQRWRRAWEDLSLAPPPHLFAAVQSAYSEAGRYYHTMRHIEECFAVLDSCGVRPDHAAELELALWFHDAVYDTHRNDNEVKSADWAARELRAAGAALRVIHRVHALVLATRHDAPAGKSVELQLVVDLDLSILGASPERFDEYEMEARREYAWVGDDVFCAGRGDVLRRFMDRKRIYNTQPMRERFELPARSNLRRSLARLAAGRTPSA